jgi:hypothetical protein
MRKKRALFIVILVLLCSSLVWFVANHERPIPVNGELPAEDEKEILRLARRQMRREYFPELSWANIKNLPRELYAYNGLSVRSIKVQYEGYVAVWIAKSDDQDESILMFKGTNGWKIMRHLDNFQ